MKTKPKALLLMDRASFTDQFDSSRLERLAGLVTLDEAVWSDSLDSPELQGQLAEIEVLITSWGVPKLTGERLEAMPNLQAVFHCAGSVRGFVSDELWARDVLVTNCADVNAVPVAEFTFASILLAGKKAQFLANDAKVYREDLSYIHGRGALGNIGRTIGVVGYSRIGRRVVKFLELLQDVECLVVDPYADPREIAAAGARLVPLEVMLPVADVVTIHAPELPETHHMMGAPQLAAMKENATLINTARGSLVDTKALEEACRTGRIHAILDVTDPEPLPGSSILYDLPNVVITPHVAGSLGSETRRMSDAALDELERYLSGQELTARVRMEELESSA